MTSFIKVSSQHVLSFSVPLSREKSLEFDNMVRDLSDVVLDPVHRKLMLLIVLTQPSNRHEKNGLSNLHSKYQQLLRRRTQWLFKSEQAVKSNCLANKMRTPDRMINKLFTCLENLNKLTEMLLYIKNVH